jgi:mRNA interferase HigB
MHLISRKVLREFWERHPDSKEPLLPWCKIIECTDYRNFAELRATFPSADIVGDFIVFNIGGSKYRLITAVHFNRSKIYIRHLLTHSDYDRGVWKI